MQTAFLAAQSLAEQPTLASNALCADAAAHAEVLRARFGLLLKSAEGVRGSLAEDMSGSRLSSSPVRGTVCVEELLYRHALSAGREAALAQEPLVGQADRAVLNKYAAGFAWRLFEISQKQRASQES
ncbi:MAG: hypothetical protein SGPRY_007450 [Prymnesium sp.]